MVRSVRPGTIILIVALLIAVRVLGLSALMPVFTPFGQTLTDNDLLVGLAFGAYGLTMALMQIPMGTLSDRFGRRPLIMIGLGLYVAGNLLAWWAPTIEILIAARLIEGVGAISSVAMALLADVVPEDRRTFSIAIAGIGAGVAFLLGVSLGGLVELAIGVRGIFLASAALGAAMFVAVALFVPDVRADATGRQERVGFWATLGDRRALSLDLAGFVMNLTLTATMFALPVLLVTEHAGPDAPFSALGYRWMLFGTVLIGGALAVGGARAVDRRGLVRPYAVLAALMIGAGAAGLLTLPTAGLLWGVGVIYFAGHAAQSASLPSLVGAFFAGDRRGTAMGGLNTFTYLGSFVGATLGALLYLRPPALPLLLLVLGATASLGLALAPSGADGPKGDGKMGGPGDR